MEFKKLSLNTVRVVRMTDIIVKKIYELGKLALPYENIKEEKTTISV